MRPNRLTSYLKSGCLSLVLILSIVNDNILMAQVKKAQPKKAVAKKTVAKRPAPKKLVAPQPEFIKVPGTRILLKTDSGDMVIRLYDSTPLHRDNFISKINQGFYDSLLFHRVIRNFMIQGGDPNSKYAQPGEMLGMGSAPGDRIPAEFSPALFHKKGALAAARDNNPERASSNCQFYIVQGRKYTDQELMGSGKQIPPNQQAVYKTLGGTPFLDQSYTVFGEVEIGLDIIDKIETTATMPGDRPVSDIRMHMQVLADEDFDILWKENLNKMRKLVPKKIPVKTIKKKRA